MKKAQTGDGNNKCSRTHRSRQGKFPRKYRRHQEGLVSKYDYKDTLIFGYTGEPVIQPSLTFDGDREYYCAHEVQELTGNLSHDLKHALMYFWHEEDIYELPEDHGQWINNENQDLVAIGSRGYNYYEFKDPEPRKLRDMIGWTHEQGNLSVDIARFLPAGDSQKSEGDDKLDFETEDIVSLLTLLRDELSHSNPICSESKQESIASSYRNRLKSRWSIHDAEVLSRILKERELTTYNCSDEVIVNLVFSPLWNRSPKTLSPSSISRQELYRELYGAYDAPSFLLARDEFSFESVVLYILMAKGYPIQEFFGLLTKEESYTKRITKCLWQIPHETKLSYGLKAACFMSNGVPLEIALAMAEIEIPSNATETIQWFQRHSDRVHPEDVQRINNYFRHVVDENGEQHNPFRAGYRRTIRAARAFDRDTQRQFKKSQKSKKSFRDDNLAANYLFETTGREVSFVQLLDSSQLAEEGKRMHHCVGFYSQNCSSGRSAIVSMRMNGKPTLTIEICLQSKTIIQVRGKYNRSARMEENEWIRRWANEKFLGYEACE